MSVTHSVLHYGYGALLRTKELIKLPFERELYINECYYPEFATRRKSPFLAYLNQAANILRYGKPNKFYFMYGFDIKDFKNRRDYVDYTFFIKHRSRLNNRPGLMSLIPVLRNKDLFGTIAEEYGFPTPHNIGIISENSIFRFDTGQEESLDIFFKQNDVDAFIKKIDGECADGVYPVKSHNGQLIVDGNSIKGIEQITAGGIFLLQSRLASQHQDINRIYPDAINTIRLVTVIDTKSMQPRALSAVLRVGAGGKHVDNWAAGGLSIGIDLKSGRLVEFGFYKPGFGTKAAVHPDTGTVFKDYEIPYIKDAIHLAIDFHKRLRNIHSIGWDIAITVNGPCFIEGNDNWEISLMQVSNKGYSKEFQELFLG